MSAATYRTDNSPPIRGCPSGCPVSDTELVSLAAAGDTGAFSALHRKYHRRVLRWSRLFAGDHGDDVAQDVWLQLAAGRWKLGPEREGNDLSPFLYGVVLRAHMRAARAARKFNVVTPKPRKHDEAESADPVDELVADAPSALDALIAYVNRRALRRAVRALPLREREILQQRYVENLTVREIAERDGRTTSGVALHLQRIHQKLSDACGGAYAPPTRATRFNPPRLTKRNWNRRLKRARERMRQLTVAA